MATELSIINTALLLAGTNQIQSLDDELREARVANAVYPTTRDDMLTSYLWDFTLGQAQLAQLVDTPLFQYDHVYQLPTDPKALRVVRKNDPVNDYTIFEDKLYTNDDNVEIIYQFDPGEANYPAYFVRTLEFKLASIFCDILLQDESSSTMFDERALRQLIKAKNINSQNAPLEQINETEFALTAVR